MGSFAHIMGNESESVGNASSIHLLHVCHHNSASNTRALIFWQDSQRMYTDCSAVLVVSCFIVYCAGTLPIPWVVHSLIRHHRLSRLRSNDMSQENTDCSIGPAGLDASSSFESSCWDIGVWCGGAEESETELPTFG